MINSRYNGSISNYTHKNLINTRKNLIKLYFSGGDVRQLLALSDRSITDTVNFIWKEDGKVKRAAAEAKLGSIVPDFTNPLANWEGK